jgi:hypothetical protein
MPRTVLLVFQDEFGRTPFADWIDGLARTQRRAYGKCLARVLQLEEQGHALRRPAADILRDRIHELRAKLGKVHYRMLYFFVERERNVACLTHGFTKEGDVPEKEIEFAIRAKKLVETDRDRYTAEWES